jgi:hypothetical protein
LDAILPHISDNYIRFNEKANLCNPDLESIRQSQMTFAGKAYSALQGIVEEIVGINVSKSDLSADKSANVVKASGNRHIANTNDLNLQEEFSN